MNVRKIAIQKGRVDWGRQEMEECGDERIKDEYYTCVKLPNNNFNN